MANDTTVHSPESSGIDMSSSADQATDTFFSDTQHGEDAFFGAVQLAEAGSPAVMVPVPQGEHVIRVNVTPGEVLELASPFDPGAAFLAREADGNLAIKVGDVTVILLGYVNANEQAPVMVQSSDGKALDIATLLASTDPTLDIQTAAGPGAPFPGGQGPDNTGAILAHLDGGDGLGGFNAVGKQDQTELGYHGIDNSIHQVPFTETTLLGSSTFPGLQEPFLQDPIVTLHDFLSNGGLSFDGFAHGFGSGADYQGFDNTQADFFGTKSSGNPGDTSGVIWHQEFKVGSAGGDIVDFCFTTYALKGEGITSNGVPLIYKVADDGTLFAFRGDGCDPKSGNDGALVFVVHLTNPLDSSVPGPHTFEADIYLVNRLDHPDHGNGADVTAVQDILNIDIPFKVTEHFDGSPQQQGGDGEGEGYYETTCGVTTVSVLDDIPVAHDTKYFNIDPTVQNELNDGGSGVTVTTDFGHVDEDWLCEGNHDQDKSKGDDIGGTCLFGTLNIDFGADGPAGYELYGGGGNSSLSSSSLSSPLCCDLPGLSLKDVPCVGQAYPSDTGQLTSHGNPLVVLAHYTDGCGVEHLVVGYEQGKEDRAELFSTSSEYSGGGCVPVFELSLHTDPNDSNFQDFKFELMGPIDHPTAGSAESNLLLTFGVNASDDDCDTITTDIKVQVNDDSPVAYNPVYFNENPTPDALTGALGNDAPSFGQVDEDWLRGGNHDIDSIIGTTKGDTTGGASVCGYLNIDYGGDGPGVFVGGGGNSGLTNTTPSTPTNIALELDTGLTQGQTFPGVKSGGQPLVVLYSSPSEIVVGIANTETPSLNNGLVKTSGTPIFSLCLDTDPCSSTFQKFVFTLYGPLDHPNGDNKETDIPLAFKVTGHDFDSDPVSTTINIRVNDDAPLAVADTDWVGQFFNDARGDGFSGVNTEISYNHADGNVLSNDHIGADAPALVVSVVYDGKSHAVGTSGVTFDTDFGTAHFDQNGNYTFDTTHSGQGNEVFTYTMKDGDGDTSKADLTITVGCGAGLFSDTLTSIERTSGDPVDTSHHVPGGAFFGDDHDNTIFGTAGDDLIQGGGGADKMSGGDGDDTFLNVDLGDLSGSNTLDGTHSIDGGAGTDTVDLSHLTAFDSAQAARIENVEVLSFVGNGATTITLDYGAAYGITQVGGLHAFTIKGDAGQDSVTLQPSDGNSWTQTGTDVVGSDGHLYNVFEAGAGAAKVTVAVDHGVTVDAS